jgi:hypothetical protein
MRTNAASSGSASVTLMGAHLGGKWGGSRRRMRRRMLTYADVCRQVGGLPKGTDKRLCCAQHLLAGCVFSSRQCGRRGRRYAGTSALLTYADVCYALVLCLSSRACGRRGRTYADVCSLLTGRRQFAPTAHVTPDADVCSALLTYADVCSLLTGRRQFAPTAHGGLAGSIRHRMRVILPPCALERDRHEPGDLKASYTIH